MRLLMLAAGVAVAAGTGLAVFRFLTGLTEAVRAFQVPPVMGF